LNNFQNKYISKSILNNANTFNSFLNEGKHSEKMQKLFGMAMTMASALAQSRDEERKRKREQEELQTKTLRQSAATRAMADRQKAQAAVNLSKSRSAYYDAQAARASFAASKIEQEVNANEISALSNANDASVPNITPPNKGKNNSENVADIAQSIRSSKASIPDPQALEVLGPRLPGGTENVSTVFPNDLPLWNAMNIPTTTTGTTTIKARRKIMDNASGKSKTEGEAPAKNILNAVINQNAPEESTTERFSFRFRGKPKVDWSGNPNTSVLNYGIKNNRGIKSRAAAATSVFNFGEAPVNIKSNDTNSDTKVPLSKPNSDKKPKTPAKRNSGKKPTNKNTSAKRKPLTTAQQRILNNIEKEKTERAKAENARLASMEKAGADMEEYRRIRALKKRGLGDRSED
jgi:hypothetical protein